MRKIFIVQLSKPLFQLGPGRVVAAMQSPRLAGQAVWTTQASAPALGFSQWRQAILSDRLQNHLTSSVNTADDSASPIRLGRRVFWRNKEACRSVARKTHQRCVSMNPGNFIVVAARHPESTAVRYGRLCWRVSILGCSSCERLPSGKD